MSGSSWRKLGDSLRVSLLPCSAVAFHSALLLLYKPHKPNVAFGFQLLFVSLLFKTHTHRDRLMKKRREERHWHSLPRSLHSPSLSDFKEGNNTKRCLSSFVVTGYWENCLTNKPRVEEGGKRKDEMEWMGQSRQGTWMNEWMNESAARRRLFHSFLTYNDAKSNITTIKYDAAACPTYSDYGTVMMKTNSFLLDTAKKHTLRAFLSSFPFIRLFPPMKGKATKVCKVDTIFSIKYRTVR